MKVINGGVRMIEIVSDSKQTNADRIRGLNDEELAKFIEATRCSFRFADEECGFPICQSMNGNYCHGIKDNEPDKDILEWLQRPGE